MFWILRGLCSFVWFVVFLPMTVALLTTQVEPLDGDSVDWTTGSTTSHPPPRRVMSLATRSWNGPVYDSFPKALEAALSSRGMAVLRDPDAMFNLHDSTTTSRPAPFTPSWFHGLESLPDTTTIPISEWSPRDTHHDFARYLHRHVLGPWGSPLSGDDDDSRDDERYAGVVSIGGARQRASRKGAAPNLSFLHQDECKFSVLMAEYAAAQSAGGAGDPRHPLDGVEDTVSVDARDGLNRAFGGVDDGNAGQDSRRRVICRQLNLWCPHEERGGDKYLVFLSRQASQALVEADLVTAHRLPRFASTSHASLDRVNHNFQLSDRAVEFVARHYADHVYAVNQPVLFVSHKTTCDADMNTGAVPTTALRDTARDAIFHCGATAQGLGHASTEMRVALLSVQG